MRNSLTHSVDPDQTVLREGQSGQVLFAFPSAHFEAILASL